MRGEDRKRLTWEDATERFLDVTEITAADRAKPMDAAFDTLAYTTHNLLTGACIVALSSELVMTCAVWLLHKNECRLRHPDLGHPQPAHELSARPCPASKLCCCVQAWRCCAPCQAQASTRATTPAA